MAEGLSARIGERLAGIGAGDVTATAVRSAQLRLLHAFGVTLASSALPPAQAAWRAAVDVGGVGDCLVFGRSERAGADDAAFINGMIGHSSLQEDAGPGGLRDGSHPGTYVIPSALAAAERARVSGKRFLLGMLAGYQAVALIGDVAPPEIVHRRFRPLAVMGPFGSAAAATVVHDGTAAEIASALDFAASMAGGTTQGIFEGTMEPYVQAGFAARSGLLAARLALAGATTSRQALEGEFGFFAVYAGEAEPSQLPAPKELAITRLGTKRYAACLQNQRTVAVIVSALPDGLPADRIAGLVVRRPALGTNGLNSPGVSRRPPFANMLQAQMSARFTAAAAVLGRAVDDPGFYQASYGDDEIRELAARTELEPADDDGVSVRVVGTDGSTTVLEDAPRNLMFPTEADVRVSFLRRSRPLLGAAAERVVELVAEIERLDDVRRLTDALQVSPR